MTPIPFGETTLMGARAKQLLASPGCSGSVLAVVSGAAYLETSSGEILWLAREDSPNHLRAVHCSMDLTAMQAGMTFSREGDLVQFSSPRLRHGWPPVSSSACLELHLSPAAPVWKPKPIGHVANRQVISARVQELLDLLDHERLNRGVDQFSSAIESVAEDVAGACRDHDLASALKSADDLVGLGTGLTPSGDDYLGGLLFAAHHSSAAFPKCGAFEPTQLEDLLERARTRTHAISYALLCDHARGEGAEPLHKVMSSLMRGESVDRLITRIRHLLRIGHTTGSELLAGLLTGMLMISDEPTRPPARNSVSALP